MTVSFGRTLNPQLPDGAVQWLPRYIVTNNFSAFCTVSDCMWWNTCMYIHSTVSRSHRQLWSKNAFKNRGVHCLHFADWLKTKWTKDKFQSNQYWCDHLCLQSSISSSRNTCTEFLKELSRELTTDDLWMKLSQSLFMWSQADLMMLRYGLCHHLDVVALWIIICLYFSALRTPSVQTKSPTPFTEMQPWTCSEPPPCFTVVCRSSYCRNLQPSVNKLSSAAAKYLQFGLISPELLLLFFCSVGRMFLYIAESLGLVSTSQVWLFGCVVYDLWHEPVFSLW